MAVPFLFLFNGRIHWIQGGEGLVRLLGRAGEEFDICEIAADFIFGKLFQNVCLHHEKLLEEGGVGDPDEEEGTFAAGNVGFLCHEAAYDFFHLFWNR